MGEWGLCSYLFATLLLLLLLLVVVVVMEVVMMVLNGARCRLLIGAIATVLIVTAKNETDTSVCSSCS